MKVAAIQGSIRVLMREITSSDQAGPVGFRTLDGSAAKNVFLFGFSLLSKQKYHILSDKKQQQKKIMQLKINWIDHQHFANQRVIQLHTNWALLDTELNT